jgi:uncharacterized protein YcbK (DUF882 family)
MKCRETWLTRVSGVASQVKHGLLGGGIACALGVSVLVSASASASAEDRTLSMYFTHTKESLTVTYKRNGRYDPCRYQEDQLVPARLAPQRTHQDVPRDSRPAVGTARRSRLQKA